jgi:hypothetical protein
MKSNKTTLKKNVCFLLSTLFLVLNFGCEGLEDWSDFNNAILLTANNTETDNGFKRYNEPEMSSQPIVEFIVDKEQPISISYSKQIQKICDYTKLPFNSISTDLWNNSLTISPQTRVIVIYDTNKLNDQSIVKLLLFVSNGGTLFLPNANEDHRMAFLYGFIPEAEFATDSKSTGFYFNRPILPNLKGKTLLKTFVHFGFDSKNFSKNVKILATAINNHSYPLIIENSIGKGKVLLFNTTTDCRKEDRGLYFAAILKGLEGIPYPIANVSTLFLDDFPSPLYNIKKEPIASEMNMTMAEFVQKVWWPDMNKLSKQYKIPYSAMTLFDYTDKIIPPFTLDQWNSIKINSNNRVEPLTDWLVREVKKNGNELAFHGYNHVSLTNKLWKNQEFIGTSLNTVKKKWSISDFGNLPTSYVPPSNVVDKKGLSELKKALPSLKYMCSLYLDENEFEEGGNREFDFDPYNYDFFDYPRISSGFYLIEDHKYNQESMYLFTGIWTHFFHPDDVFEVPQKGDDARTIRDLRNRLNFGWYKTQGANTSMLSEFKSFLKQKTNSFPQMRFLNANDGAKLVMNWRASRYIHKSENGLFTIKEINPDNSKQYWFLYSSMANVSAIEANLKDQIVSMSKTPFLDGYLFTICSKKPKLVVVDLHFVDDKQKYIQDNINQKVITDFNNYKSAVKKFQKGTIWVDDSNIKLKAELASLKMKMDASECIDSITWNRYAKIISWDNRGEEVWKTYEEHSTKYPSNENIMYSKELDRIIGYPNDLIKEKWMRKQMLVMPNNEELLNNYVANFNTDDNKEFIKNVLKKLCYLDNTLPNLKNYYSHLMQYFPDEALKELCNTRANENLSELASQIVWLFADVNEYQKAYDWSEFSTQIDFVTKTSWLFNLKKYNQVETDYVNYIATHPNDYKAIAFMVVVYHEMGKFKDAWRLANLLPENSEKEELRKMLNKDVVFEKESLKLDLMANHSALFYPNVLQLLIKENRLSKGDFVAILSSLETNQKNNAIQKNLMSYNHFDQNSNLHTISGTYNKYYKQKLNKEYENNFDNHLFGLQYQFTSPEISEKPKYWSRVRVELDKFKKGYYEFGVGYNESKNKKFKSAEFNLFPVETAPGLNQKTYQLRLNLYQNFYLFKMINTSISLEGNYYTDGLLSKDTINTSLIITKQKAREKYTVIDNDHTEIATYDDVFEGSISTRIMLDKGVVRKSKFIPLLESQYSQASRDQSTGYPYWIIKHRFYGGIGLGWELVITNFHSKLEASYFLDDYSANFKRYTGNVSYQLIDYTALTLNFEYFSQSKYYSNSIQFGIKHNFKKKIKK